jgi:type VI secretion system VasD/TssJ family lipoprotein
VALKKVTMFFFVMVIGACASQAPPPNWTYEKDAIAVHFKADPNLNYDEGEPHTLMACLYQLKDPNAFYQLSDDSDGIYKLLECGLFDSAVATAKRIIIRPGKKTHISLDRAEGAKYLAAVAGYYVLEKERITRLYKIPVVVEKKGLIRRTKVSKPKKLIVDMELGPSQIR